MEDNLALIEITGGFLKANIDYTPSTNQFLIQNGGIISFWSLSSDEKRILQIYRNITQIKLFKSGKYFILAYALMDVIEIELYDSFNFRLIKQKKIILNTPDDAGELVIKNLFLTFILKDTLLIVAKGNTKRNWLIQIRFEKLTYDIIEEFIGSFKGKVKNAVGIKTNHSNVLITVNKKKIYYWIYNINNKEIALVNKINPKLNLNHKSCSLCHTSNLLGILSKKGDCFIYDMSANCKGKLSNESIQFTYLSFEDGIVILGGIDGKVYVYDQYNLNIKYVIETDQNSLNNISLFKVYLNEEKDTLILFRLNGSFEYYSLGELLKEKQSKPKPLIKINYHNDNILSLEWLNEPPLTFYTSGTDNQLIKWYYRGDKWISESQCLPKERHITCLKVHPQYNNFLFASDNNGNIIQMDLCSKEDSIKTFKVANFPIECLSFNRGNYVAISLNTGMIMIYVIDFNSKCDFSLKLYEDFINENIVLKKKENNKMTSFIHFLSEDNMVIFQSGMNKIALAGINRINNIMIPSIEEELEYDLNDDINDIAVHPSDKYIFVLLQSKQINIREINTWKNAGVIELNNKVDDASRLNIDYTGTFLSVLVTNIKSSMKNSNILIYEISTGELVTETGDLFPISKHIISNDGRFIIATGMDGAISIIKLSKAIKEKIYSVHDLINTNEKYWKEYIIDYPIHRRVIRKVQEVIENKVVHKALKKKESRNNGKEQLTGELNKQSSVISSSNKYTQENKQDNNKKSTNLNNIPTINASSTSRDINNCWINTAKSNYFNIQTNQKCNTMDSFNAHRLMQNISWDKQKQYSQLAYSHKNMIPLNKDPNIFPIDHSGLIQKVNQSYLNSQVLAYPQLTKNLIESSSKSQQDEIRYRNITNAIQQILTQDNSKMDKSQLQVTKTGQSAKTLNTQVKINRKMNEDYYINNTKKTVNDQYLPNPEGIDDLSIINTKDNDRREDSSVVMNKSDISFISTVTKNCKISVADDIDYISDNIYRFEHQYKDYDD